jgi:uncharacterized protein
LKYKTGIKLIDEVFDGGLPQGTLNILWSEPGILNMPFCFQIIDEHLTNNNKILFFTQTKTSNLILKEVEKYGWNFRDKYNTDLIFIDSYSSLINRESKDKLKIDDPSNIKEFTKILDEQLIKNPDSIVVFESLSSLISDNFNELSTEIEKWKDLFLKYNAIGIFLFTNWNYTDEIQTKIENVADSIIKFKAIEEKVILREYFTIEKCIWNKYEKKGIPFKILEPGGVRIYIPKILVTGDFNAGKSSFVNSASDKAISVDRTGTTVALDHGHTEFDGFSVDLFGTPGQARFDPLLKRLGSEALGVIIMVDSTDPGTFDRTKEMLTKSTTKGLPLVIAANKADLEGAVNPEEIRKKLELSLEIPIVQIHLETDFIPKEKEISKLKKEDVQKVLRLLFEKII